MKAQDLLSWDVQDSEQFIARSSISSDLDAYGAAILPSLLSADQCHAITSLCADPTLRRTPPVADQRDWGAGTYRYFTYPMPELIAGLRSALYSHLAPIANAWNDRIEFPERFPKSTSAIPENVPRCRPDPPDIDVGGVRRWRA